MSKYLQVSLYTLFGIKKVIDLSWRNYGEFIIYDKEAPKYHVNLFKKNASDMLIKSLVESKQETIDSIIQRINIKQGLKLSLGNWPTFSIIKKEEPIELDLLPLPESWIKNI